MNNGHACTIFTVFVLLSLLANGETEQVRDALVTFMQKLSINYNQREANWGWNTSTDPCDHGWKGVSCYDHSPTVRRIVLDGLNLTGTLDATSVCATTSLAVLSLNGNNIAGTLPDEISNCQRLTHLYLQGNNFTGNLPGSLAKLSNLKRLFISDNNFSGNIPDLSRISGLITFLAENNNLSGSIPRFEFSRLDDFNVSNNNLSGSIPDVNGRFNATSFLGNPGLCGNPLSNLCPVPKKNLPPENRHSSSKQYLIYTGYAMIGLMAIVLVAFVIIKRTKSKGKTSFSKKGLSSSSQSDKISGRSSDSTKTSGKNRSEYSITSVESTMGSSSLVVLSSPVVTGLRFEDLLRSPAELIGRGRHGSLYKVTLNGSGVVLAVKRIRDWDISRDEFKKRMQRMDQLKHPNLMSVVAYYCSEQEKLLVYEFQHNGSLFGLLHGPQNNQPFNWQSRLGVATKIANALSFIHESLRNDGVSLSHGNLKSSNILFNKEMEPCINEYGLMESNILNDGFLENMSLSPLHGPEPDTYSFGIILLELLTGKLVQNNGYDIALWVNSAIREEWTVEVFDKVLVAEGASEENMVNLLHVALKCINSSSETRPSMKEVAAMLNTLKESEENSINSEADP